MHECVAERPRRPTAALGHVQPDVVELHDQRDDAIDAHGNGHSDDNKGDGGRHQSEVPEAGERDGHDLGRQDEVGADGALDLHLLKLVRVAHRVDQLFLMLVLMEQFFEDLFSRLEGQIGAADHQQGRDEEGREGSQQKRARKQEQNLVLEAPPGDLADDRQLAFGREPRHIARGHRGIVDDHARRLRARLAGRGADIVERSRGELGDGCYIVQESNQS